jgi:hypothetical protein
VDIDMTAAIAAIRATAEPAPRKFTYYLGVPEPSWLGHCDGVPKFVSVARFDRYTTEGDRWPVRSASSYAIDSGAYIALTGRNKRVPWFDDPDVYGGKILRFIDNTGYPPEFAAIQDFPCEPNAQRATGLTVRDHQDLTTDSYEWLIREFPMVPWIPVLQGEKPGDHVVHAKMYADRGIDLAACHRVGVGSICRLTELDGLVERIRQLEDLAAQGLKLHGFGIKTDALPLIGHVLASADSMAWSAHVRHNGCRNPIRLPGCTHAGDCRNCYRYAVHWREQVLASLTARKGPTPMLPAPAPTAEQGDLFSGLLSLTSLVADNAAKKTARKKPPRTVQEPPEDLFALLNLTSVIADNTAAAKAGPVDVTTVAWGTYGTVSPAWGPDGSVQKERTGYITKTARIYSGGLMGHTKGPKSKGEALLHFGIEVTGGGQVGLYARPGATFTVRNPPAEHPLRAEKLLSRRLPFADLRPGDVFHVWDEREGVRGLLHKGGCNVADLCRRYHVQTVPRQDGEGCFSVDVLVDGEGPVVALRRGALLWVDIDDPRRQPWHDAANLELVNPAVAGRRALADRLGPGRTVLAGDQGVAGGVVAVDDAAAEAAVGECFGRSYRWWFARDGLHFYRPAGGDQFGPVGGRYVLAGDGYDDVRATLAEAVIEFHGLVLRGDLPPELWERTHALLRGMGATGGARKRQPYELKNSRLPDLWAFIAGGPAPKHERTTAGWVRTPDKLAADVVARFAELDRVPRHDGRDGGVAACECCEHPRVLEPSAGDGALVAAVLAAAPDANLFAVEPDPGRAAKLRQVGGFPVHECTFEEFAERFDSPSLKGYDLVVMNPPYSSPGNPGLWALHVKLAWGLLAAGGRLVAILPGRPDAQGRLIRSVLEMVGADVRAEQLPARSFRQPGKGGADVDTWVLAATKPAGSMMKARRVYADRCYRPAEGEPVRVAELRLNRADAQATPVQACRDWGGDFVARFVGRCIVCTVSCWGRDDGADDPRGLLGYNAVATLRADEHGMAGPDVCLCWGCNDSGIMRNRGLVRARTMWNTPRSR